VVVVVVVVVVGGTTMSWADDICIRVAILNRDDSFIIDVYCCLFVDVCNV